MEDIDKLVENADSMYQEKFLNELGKEYSDTLRQQKEWRFAGVPMTCDFYKTLQQKNYKKCFVIISDGLRYEIVQELYDRYGEMHAAEYDWALTAEKKEQIHQMIMVEKQLPSFEQNVVRVNYMDGCKVYFENGWVIVRPSGTEPRIRIFAEAPTKQEAEALVRKMAAFTGLE